MMTDYSELKRLAEAAIEYAKENDERWPQDDDWFEPDRYGAELEYVKAISPAAVMPLIAEVEELRAQHGRDSAEMRSLCQSRDDARKERDILKSELARLRNGGQVSKGEIERLEEFKRQVRENRRDRF